MNRLANDTIIVLEIRDSQNLAKLGHGCTTKLIDGDRERIEFRFNWRCGWVATMVPHCDLRSTFWFPVVSMYLASNPLSCIRKYVQPPPPPHLSSFWHKVNCSLERMYIVLLWTCCQGQCVVFLFILWLGESIGLSEMQLKFQLGTCYLQHLPSHFL